MSAYPPSGRDQAARLVATLLDPPLNTFRPGFPGRPHGYVSMPEENGPDIYWADVLNDVGQYREQTAFCVAHGFPVLCIEPSTQDGRPTPVLLSTDETARLFQPLRPSDDPLQALEAAAHIRLASSVQVVAYSPTAAMGFYKAGLTDFLTVRLAARASGATSVTRYKFDLTTKTSGVTAYWTQAGALRRGNFFGHPTPAVSGTLPAGLYCFGAGSTGGTATYDMTTYFDVPTDDKGYVSV